MKNPAPEISVKILDLLHDGPILQKDIWRSLPLEWDSYINPTVRAMEADGLITRERTGATYLIKLGAEK